MRDRGKRARLLRDDHSLESAGPQDQVTGPGPNGGTARAKPRASLVRGLTLLGAVALVVGNMVGTSVYTLPASLARTTGPFGVVAWLFTAVGYLFVALVYASLGTRYPRTGGPYVYAREAFGDFAGFQTVWAYWFSCVIGNAAIVTGVVGYATGFSTVLAGSVLLQFLLAQALLWGLCVLNVTGIRQSARVQITIMFLNIVPLLLLIGPTLLVFDAANLTPFAPQGVSSLAAGAALVVWAYSGVESATVPAEEVQAPERTIRWGTMLGYSLGTLVFLLTAVAVAGALPNEIIAGSPRPIGLAVEHAVGPWGGAVIGVVAIIAGLGTLNGWTLMAGRIPLGAAADGIFFPRLATIHPRFGTPYVALIVGTLISSAMLFLFFAKTLLGVFEFIVLLAVLTTLLPHLYAAAAELMLARRDPERYAPSARRRAHIVAPIAFVFVMYTIYGVGAEVALWGFLVVLAGTPLYIWFATRGRGANDGGGAIRGVEPREPHQHESR
ncbi:MAG: amino acid permease [Gemmatimonadota bacterium]|nr:amino acid permease [Gemmatimonadota bacterium]